MGYFPFVRGVCNLARCMKLSAVDANPPKMIKHVKIY